MFMYQESILSINISFVLTIFIILFHENVSLQEERKSFAVTYERSHWRKVISLYKTETTKEENKVVIIYKEIISYIFLYAKMGIHVMLLVLNVSIESTRKSYANSYIQTHRCKYHYHTASSCLTGD